MKLRTAMKSMLGICEVKSEGCLASKVPQEIEVIFVGPEEKATCACSNCISKKIKSGEWAMWYSPDS